MPGVFGYAAGLLILLIPVKDPAFYVLIAILAMALGLRSRNLGAALPYAAALVFGIAYVFGSLRCGIDLREISPYWLFFGLSLNWAGDMAALYIGKLLGNNRLSPRISPAKSWEGGLGSVAASVLYGAIYLPRLLPAVPVVGRFALASLAHIARAILHL